VTADLLRQIRDLEPLVRRLDPGQPERAALARLAFGYADRFLDGLVEAPAYVAGPGPPRSVPELLPVDEPADPAQLLAFLRKHVDGPGINPASGGHLGYIPGGGLWAGAIGDFLAAATNRYPGVTFASPGAVAMEDALLRWMADLIGYPDTAAGTFCSGGSIANLTAIVTARDACGLRSADVPRAVVYVTSQTHHCVPKALRIAGLEEAVVRTLPTDQRFRLDVSALDRQVRADRDEGLRPWLIVASAGSTDTGAVDPIPAVADVAEANGAWLHVDGAYGGFFALTEHGYRLFSGIERADSIVMDPHKTLFAHYGSGVVLVKDRELLRRSFAMEAAYMQDARAVSPEPTPADLSPELTRPFRGLALWLPLKLHGVAPFRAALEEKLLLARYFRLRVADLGYWVGPEPDLSVVVYRYPARDLEVGNRINREILEAIHRDGRIFVSSTMLDGAFTLRFAAVVHRTHLDTVDTLLGLLGRLASTAGSG